jgi:hypothetical protein
MPTLRTRILFFLSSYVPLFVIIGILVFQKNWIAATVIFFLSACFTFALWFYVHYYYRHTHKRGFSKLRAYRSRDSEAMSYIASYIVPFATFPLDGWTQILALTVFLGVLLMLYVNSNMIYVNPLLNVVGYHLYEIEVEYSDHSRYYLARKRLARDEMIYYVEISSDVWLEAKKRLSTQGL